MTAMRNAFALLLAIALSCAGFHVRAGDASPQDPPLEDQMRGLMNGFQQLEKHLAVRPPRYEEIVKILDGMAVRATTVKGLKGEDHSPKDMKRLTADIENFRREAARKSASGAEDGMNRLSENCFRCHLSHSSPESAKKSSIP